MALTRLVVGLVFGIEIANIIMLILLLWVFWSGYKRVKSRFTLGLMLFTVAFLLKSIIYLLSIMFILRRTTDLPTHGPGAPFTLLMISMIECIALVILLRITWE